MTKAWRRAGVIALALAVISLLFAARAFRREERDRAPSPSRDDDSPKESHALPVGARCTFDIECATGICYPFPERGPHCTQPCEKNRDCPDGSTCSRRNFCK